MIENSFHKRSNLVKMSNVTVSVRFRPFNSREKREGSDSVCFQIMDEESFLFKDEKEEEHAFSFDRVFYQRSTQADVYNFMAKPIVKDAVNGINGTIITYGQTGAGKTYSMEGPSILGCDEQQKGILPRVFEGLFESIKCVDGVAKYTVKLSMVEIYMEKIRDLFDTSNDYVQVKEIKGQGIFLLGTTEICIINPEEALSYLSEGIANRAVGETQMNMASSRSHCIFVISIQETDQRVRGKLILVDLAGNEKVEKTGAEGRVLEEAKNINKSLSALGNVIKALTSDKTNHVPFRDSKLTRILQDSLGGNSRTALLCCCSPSFLNASESLSTLRFGARTKQVRISPRFNCNEDKVKVKQEILKYETNCHSSSELSNIILHKLKENLNVEVVNTLKELFTMGGIIFDPPEQFEDLALAADEAINQTLLSLHQTVEVLSKAVEQLTMENIALKSKVYTTTYLKANAIGSSNLHCSDSNMERGNKFSVSILRIGGLVSNGIYIWRMVVWKLIALWRRCIAPTRFWLLFA
ncbi:kinesin-like protein KIN-1 isoform X2 [Amborella trichopoda]|uniref:kinesin-like protein KIN-1 isoform X2 n=1 Tax=Amborella trichopoda TaxID=13333 RepID=UPI0009BD2107|nr:kinesin-like protein KIN-1 isoform X2 [Amborella trichopoda]|eukprot:XP_020520651.1 kinesin-like protein KIN-1 isoform X2 [Amborella trichopoda]